MRRAETVLGIIRERGTRGQPLEDIYRQLYNPDLYLRAYDRLYANKGAMTPGATGRPWTGCHWTRSTRSSPICGMNAIGGRQ